MTLPYRPSWIALALALMTFLAFVGWYQGEPPLESSEIDRTIAALERQPSESRGDFDVPAFRRFLETDDGEPFYNVNLFKFRERARYTDGGDRGRSGREAFRRYGDFMVRTLPSMGSHLVFASNWIATSDWDLVAIVRYRSRRDFAELVRSPAFAAAVVDKWAALEGNVRVPVQSAGFFTNAYWVVGALLALGVLLVSGLETLQRRRRARRAPAVRGSSMLQNALFLGLLGFGCSDEGPAEGSCAPSASAVSPPDGGRGARHTDASHDAARDLDTFERIEIPVGEFVFDARAAGPADGELVLLLHGFPQTSYQWRSQLGALADAGYRAVAPDQRGYSPRARPDEVRAYGVANLVLDVLGMAAALGYDTFHLVGHDWGGGVAWGVAGVFPERAKTLTILSTPHPAALVSALEDPNSCQYAASAYFDVVTEPGVTADALQDGAFDEGLDALPEAARAEYERAVVSDPAAFEAAVSWYRANIEDRVFTGSAGAIDVPTTYLWGTEDPFFCRDTAEGSAAYVTGEYRFIEVESAGHWLSDLAPEVVNQALLERVRSQ